MVSFPSLVTFSLILVARIETKKEYWFWNQAGVVWKDVPSAFFGVLP